jgi:hypothetical protein
MRRTFGAILVVMAVAAATGRLEAASFSAGSLAVFQAASSSANNTTGTIVEVAQNTPAQAPSNLIAIPSTGASALRFSGSATSTGYLSHTNDRSLLTFTGGNSETTSGNVNTFLLRGVGTLNAAGTYALSTTYTGATGNQTRSASSPDNAAWYIGDQGGIYSNGTSSASPSGNIRSVKAFGGTVYAFSASTTVTPVSTISAPTGGTLTGLPGLPLAVAAMQDFYMVQSGSNGVTYDVLYVLSATSNTVGAIDKYSLVAGSWVANGSSATAFGGFGLAATAGAGAPGAKLFITTGQGALAANSVLQLADTTGYNAAINIVTANNITLYTTPAGTTLKGIDLAPAVPEPATLGMAAMLFGAIGFCSRRRRLANA